MIFGILSITLGYQLGPKELVNNQQLCKEGFNMWAHGGQWIYIGVHAFSQILFYWAVQDLFLNSKYYLTEPSLPSSNMMAEFDPTSK